MSQVSLPTCVSHVSIPCAPVTCSGQNKMEMLSFPFSTEINALF